MNTQNQSELYLTHEQEKITSNFQIQVAHAGRSRLGTYTGGEVRPGILLERQEYSQTVEWMQKVGSTGTDFVNLVLE